MKMEELEIKEVKCPRCGKKHKIVVAPVFFGDQTICGECGKTKIYKKS